MIGVVEMVDEAEFVTFEEARRELGLPQRWLWMLASGGLLQPCRTLAEPWRGEDIGITRSSLDAELPHWTNPSNRRERKRLVRRSSLVGRWPISRRG